MLPITQRAIKQFMIGIPLETENEMNGDYAQNEGF